MNCMTYFSRLITNTFHTAKYKNLIDATYCQQLANNLLRFKNWNKTTTTRIKQTNKHNKFQCEILLTDFLSVGFRHFDFSQWGISFSSTFYSPKKEMWISFQKYVWYIVKHRRYLFFNFRRQQILWDLLIVYLELCFKNFLYELWRQS